MNEAKPCWRNRPQRQRARERDSSRRLPRPHAQRPGQPEPVRLDRMRMHEQARHRPRPYPEPCDPRSTLSPQRPLPAADRGRAMHKTLLLLTLPTLLPACLEPNAMNLGGPEDETDTEAMPMADETGDPNDPNDPSDPDGPSDPDDPNDPDDPADETSGGSETDGGESGGFPEPNCDLETHACISNVPDGWNGPIAHIDADNDLGCHAPFAQAAFTSFEGISAEPASCTCECGAPVGGSCSNQVVVDLYPLVTIPDGGSYNNYACEWLLADDLVVASGAFTDYPAQWDTRDTRFSAEPPAVQAPGSCGVAMEATQLPDPGFIGAREVCASEEFFGSCDAETMCVPKPAAPFEAGVCIWSEGNVACPGGTDFVNREVRSTGVIDDRSCSECSCSGAIGQSCNDAELRFMGLHPLLADAAAEIDGTCNFVEHGSADVWTALTLVPGSPSGGSCAEQGGNPQGTVQPESQITFCCT